MQNVATAFRLHKEAKLQNRHILLVDDIITTGATLEACASILTRVPGLTLSMATIGIAR